VQGVALNFFAGRKTSKIAPLAELNAAYVNITTCASRSAGGKKTTQHV